MATRLNVADGVPPQDDSAHPAVVIGVPRLPVTGIFGIPPIITSQPAVESPKGVENLSVKSLFGGNRHAMANPLAAIDQPMQQVNLGYSLIVTKDRAVMAGPHVAIRDSIRSHLVKNHGVVSLPAMISPHILNAYPKKKYKGARQLLHTTKRNLSEVSQSSTSGLTLGISHLAKCPDQTNQKVVHHGNLQCSKNAAAAKAMHSHKVVKAH